MKRTGFLQPTCLCIALFLGLTMCKKENPASINLSEPVVNLSSTVKSFQVKVTSNVDWICTGGEKAFGPAIMAFDWIEVEPFASKAGTTEMSIKLIEDKIPAKEASLSVKLQAQDGSPTATLMVRYKP